MSDWPMDKTIVFIIPFALLLIGILVFFLMRKTIRTRMRVNAKLQQDQDINEWLVVFDWSRKILYFPTIFASIGAGLLTIFLSPIPEQQFLIGGCWLGVFFLNFLIDEYELSVKLLLLFLVLALLSGLWLLYLGWLKEFLNLFGHLKVTMSAMGYFVIAAIFSIAIIIAWIKGLFYYIAITPNYLNIQVGPTETGEQVSQADYSTRVDTGDFLERLLGFGRIVITFRDHRRPPISILTGRIGQKAQLLESIRGKLAVDRYKSPNNQPHNEDI